MRYSLLLVVAAIVTVTACNQEKTSTKNKYILKADSVLASTNLLDPSASSRALPILLDFYDSATLDDPDNLDAFELKSDIQIRMSDLVGALKTLEEITVRFGDMPHVTLQKGAIHEKMGYQDLAIKFYLKAIEQFDEKIRIEGQTQNSLVNRFGAFMLAHGEQSAMNEFERYDFDDNENKEAVKTFLEQADSQNLVNAMTT